MSDDPTPTESASDGRGDAPAVMARRGLARLDATAVLEVVDSLDLRPSARLSPAVAVPLRGLHQRRDLSVFVAGAPIVAVRALLELMVAGALDRVVTALGDHADHPSYEQLARAVDTLASDGVTADEIAALLAFAVSESFPAAPHCRRLLGERSEWELPAVAVVPARSVLSPREVDPEVRARRQARQEAEKAQRRTTTRPVSRGPKTKGPTGAPAAATPSTATPSPDVAIEVVRRRARLTPAEARRVDLAHPLAGAVVHVEMPFSEPDPAQPEIRSKERPALVVAASTDAVLVRGVYSNPGPGRQVFGPWRRLGLDHVSYVADEHVLIEAAPSDVREVGRLSDEEWNSLQ